MGSKNNASPNSLFVAGSFLKSDLEADNTTNIVNKLRVHIFLNMKAKLVLRINFVELEKLIFRMTPERKQRINEVLRHRQNDLTVILENVHDPHNISAVMRSCDAVGISEIYVLNNRIGKHKRWGERSSSSASKWMMIHQFTETEACFQQVRKKYQTIYSTHLNETSTDLYALDLVQPVALVFGNEGEGITTETLACCDGNFTIPQVGMIQSLNISVACAVTIYEAMRQKRLVGHYHESRLDSSEKSRLLDFWQVPDLTNGSES